MKSNAVAAILFAGTLAFLAPRPASAAWSVSISYFHQELAPYGRWVSTATYGEVWYPTVVAAGWQPYLDGEWIYTDYGWTWVSYDPFGADPFHYGTWVWVDPYGWSWVPGVVWGPAWVTWAYTDSYIGWACLPPSFEITVAGYGGGPIVVPQNQYVFVPVNSFIGTTVSSVRVPVQQNAAILTDARKVTRFSVSGGIVRATDPPPTIVQRMTGRTLQRTSLGSHKLRATTIAAAGVASGKRIRIVAPARERAAVSTGTKPSNPKVAQHAAQTGKKMREAAAKSAITSRRPARAVKEKPPGGHPAGEEKATRAPHNAPPSHEKALRAPQREKPPGGHPAGAEKATRAPHNAPPSHAKVASAPQRAAREIQGREIKASRSRVSIERQPSSASAKPPKEIRRERPSAPAPETVVRRQENPPAIKHEKGPGATSMPPAAEPEASRAHPAPPPAAAAKPPEQPPAPPKPQPKGPPAGQKEKGKE